MNVQFQFPLTEQLFALHATDLGADLVPYRNHIFRMLNFVRALSGADALSDAVLIAAAFHDIGIWTDHTWDYLEPSVRRAQNYLAANGRENLGDEVAALIREHHKVLPYRSAFAETVECFRKADLVDVSLGLVRFGLPRTFVREVKVAFPNSGFHRRLLQLTARQLRHSPLRPMPMMRW